MIGFHRHFENGGRLITLFPAQHSTGLVGRKFEGKIARTAESISPGTRTLLTEIQVDNSAGRLLPGMYAKVALTVKRSQPTVIVPGNALITNDDMRTRLHIEGDAPILREKDIMREDEATTPCKRVYFTVQLMYLAADAQKIHKTYFDQVHDVMKAAPSSAFFFAKINDHLLNGEYYKAMKEARNLVEHEREILADAS